jgi:hypothetical protein
MLIAGTWIKNQFTKKINPCKMLVIKYIVFNTVITEWNITKLTICLEQRNFLQLKIAACFKRGNK